MAKKSSVQKNHKRIKLSKKFETRRQELKNIIYNQSTSLGDKFSASLKLSELPRNSSKTRIRNRCALSGRPRAYYRKFGLSRIALRDLASFGMLPGVIKASW